ncbi:membrane protein [Escherichia coli]|nr:membrane protein [Escherichia coli]
MLGKKKEANKYPLTGSDSNLLIVFYVQIMPDDLVMQLHRF